MNILIIGGTGFMGPCVMKLLCEEGHRVTLFHRGKSKIELPDGVKEILGDRDNLADFKEDFKKVSPHIVLHMILMSEKETLNVTEIFKDMAQRIVAISSMDVYRSFGRVIGVEKGSVEDGIITEESPLRETYYPYRNIIKDRPDYDKILVEKVIMNNYLPGTVLRLPMVYGPNDRQHRVGEILKDMRNSSITLDHNFASWICARGYSENMAKAIALAVTDEKASGKIYNVSEENTLSTIEWVRNIGKLSGWTGEIIIKDEDDKNNGNDNYSQNIIVSSKKIRNELGYKEIISFEEGLKRTIKWEKENGGK